MTINTETIRDAAGVLDALTSRLPDNHPLRVEATSRAKSCVSGLYSAADALDAQAAEIARLREALRWLSAGFEAGRDNASRMFEESGNLYHEGRKVAYDQTAADARAELAQEGS